jgi:hypothetical protein
MPSIQYASDAVIVRRLQTIAKAIGEQNRERSLALVRDTLYILRNSKEWDMTPRALNHAIGVFYKTLVELAMHRYTSAHDQIRGLYYNIESKYIGNYSGLVQGNMVSV